jgi:hypothetical protein
VRCRPAIAALIAVVFMALTGIAVQRSLHVATVEGLNANLQRTNSDLKDALATAQASETAARESEVAAREGEAAAHASKHDAINIAYASDMNIARRAREEGDLVEFMNLLNRYGDGAEHASYRASSGTTWPGSISRSGMSGTHSSSRCMPSRSPQTETRLRLPARISSSDSPNRAGTGSLASLPSNRETSTQSRSPVI